MIRKTVGLDGEHGLFADFVVNQKIDMCKTVFCISALDFVEQREVADQHPQGQMAHDVEMPHRCVVAQNVMRLF